MCDNNTNIYIDTVSVRPLTFWKEHQARFPAIAALAREIHSHFQQLAQELNASLIPLEIFVTIVVVE